MSIQRHDTKARMSRAVIHQGVAYLCGQVAVLRRAMATSKRKLRACWRGRCAAKRDWLQPRAAAKCHYLPERWWRFRSDERSMGCLGARCYAPARTCVCAPMPADELKVEITVTTAVDA